MVNAWYTVHKALAKRPWWSLALLVLLFAGMTYVTVGTAARMRAR